MSSILMGTAGHIDHGKTSLIRALTGVDLDRLEEEKRRGITIELGFVALDLGGGERIGVVDVPGHERFIKTMVAGAQGIDIALLVVAADEGVMPQTVEHLDICRLLGVQKGVIALTKSDRADEETRSLAEMEIRELVKGTFLDDAPIVQCSAVTGDGIEELRKTIAQIAKSLPQRSDKGLFRMPIDRSFSIKGFGTVVTGSVIAGGIAKGEEVEVIPGGKKAIVRELEVHGEKVESAGAGNRLAVNLAGMERLEAGRGQWLAKPGSILVTRVADVRIEVLPKAGGALKPGKISIHVGTAHILAEVDLFGREKLGAGESDAARIFAEKPLALAAGDRFVLRSFARHITVAGGTVIDPLPWERLAHRKRREKAEAKQFLLKLDAATINERIEMLVTASGTRGSVTGHLAQRLPVTLEEYETAANTLEQGGKIIRIAGKVELFVAKNVFETLKSEIVEELRNYHNAHPMETGISRGALKNTRFRRANEAIFAEALESLFKGGQIEREGDLLRIAGFSAHAEDKDRKIVEVIEDALKKGGWTPPSPALIAESLGKDKKEILRLLKFLMERGRARRVSEDLYYQSATIEEIRKMLETYLAGHESIEAVNFKELAGLSRKFAIALLEYFDRERVTIRVGDKRILRKAGDKEAIDK